MLLLIQYTLIFASVLILVALGGCFSEHSGVINIGLEGIMVMGALGGALMMKYLPDSAYVIALAIEGKKLTSEKLAEKIDSLGISGTSHLVFLIGGSLGMSDRLLKRADYLLSFSDMTFPHQLMRVILLEQVYRSYRIIHGEPYHK